MTKRKESKNHAGTKQKPAVKQPRYAACRDWKPPKAVRDPAAPPKGAPRPARGIGSPSAERTSVPLEWHGHRMSKAAWARYLNISRRTLTYRLSRYSVEVALSPDFRRIFLERAKAAGFWRRAHAVTEKSLAASRRNIAKAHAASVTRATRYAAFGENLTCAEWAARLGVKWHTLFLRLKRMPVEDALRTGRFDELVKKGRIKATLKPEAAGRSTASVFRPRKTRAAKGGTIPFPYQTSTRRRRS